MPDAADHPRRREIGLLRVSRLRHSDGVARGLLGGLRSAPRILVDVVLCHDSLGRRVRRFPQPLFRGVPGELRLADTAAGQRHMGHLFAQHDDGAQ